jgi:hypothetical protein
MLALLFGALGVYCWVDPFFTSEGIGSGISSLAGWGGVGLSFVLGIVGAILTRRILPTLVLLNLEVFVAVALLRVRESYFVRESYTVVGRAVPDFVSRTRWELVFAILAVSVLISVALFVLLPKSRNGGAVLGTPPRRSFQGPAHSDREQGSS